MVAVNKRKAESPEGEIHREEHLHLKRKKRRGVLKNEVTSLEEKMTSLEEKMSSLEEEVRRSSEAREERQKWFQRFEDRLEKIEKKNKLLKQNEEAAVLRQMAFDVERKIKFTIIRSFSRRAKNYFFYREGDPIDWRIDALDIRLEMEHPTTRNVVLKAYFDDDDTKYSEFCDTMHVLKGGVYEHPDFY